MKRWNGLTEAQREATIQHIIANSESFKYVDNAPESQKVEAAIVLAKDAYYPDKEIDTVLFVDDYIW